MGLLLALDSALRRLLALIGRAAGWLMLALMAVIMLDVATRRFLVVGSTRLQELEWHLHTFLFALALGYVYVLDGHVRIEILRERMSPQLRAWIELIGVLALLLPFAAVVLHYGIEFAATSFLQGERSPSPAGLSHRWIVKSAIPLGIGLLLLAGLSVLVRKALFLFGGERAHRALAERESP